MITFSEMFRSERLPCGANGTESMNYHKNENVRGDFLPDRVRFRWKSSLFVYFYPYSDSQGWRVFSPLVLPLTERCKLFQEPYTFSLGDWKSTSYGRECFKDYKRAPFVIPLNYKLYS